MNKKEVNKSFELFLLFGILFILYSSFVSAGVGIKWDRETAVVNENSETCMTYQIYNPWPKDCYAKIELSEELQPLLTDAESEVKYIAAQTSSANAIPIEFCFRTPKVYKQDCLLFNSLICRRDCAEPQVVYTGQVNAMETPKDITIGGAGGSSTSMTVAAPLKIKVACVKTGRNYSVVYLAIGLVALILLALSFIRRSKREKNKKKK